MSIRNRGRSPRAAFYAGSIAALWASAVSATPTGQRLAEIVAHGLVGTPAPALVVHTIDGKSIDLGKLYGKKAVYLKFWATWCGPCRKQMPHFEHAYETAGPNLAVIGINTGIDDSLADVRKLIRKDGLKMPTVIDDGRLAAAFNLRVTPQHIVIGRDGRIQYVGHAADARVDAALRAAQSPASARAVAAKQTGLRVPAAVKRYSVGDALPDLSAVTLDGAPFRTRGASARRPTVFVFLLPWCESYFAKSRPALATSCRQVREQVASLASRDDRVRWLGVVSGLWSTPHDLNTYEAKYLPRIPLTFDASGEWFHTFDVLHVPTIVIADSSGTIVKRVEGFDADLAAEIHGALGN